MKNNNGIDGGNEKSVTRERKLVILAHRQATHTHTRMKLWRLKIVPAASAKSKVCDVEKERLNGLVICMRNFDRR